MSKTRTFKVNERKKKDPLHCGTISVEAQMTMTRRGRRQAQIDSGINVASGSGVHGGGKRERARKDRREGRDQIRSGRFDD